MAFRHFYGHRQVNLKSLLYTFQHGNLSSWLSPDIFLPFGLSFAFLACSLPCHIALLALILPFSFFELSLLFRLFCKMTFRCLLIPASHFTKFLPEDFMNPAQLSHLPGTRGFRRVVSRNRGNILIDFPGTE